MGLAPSYDLATHCDLPIVARVWPRSSEDHADLTSSLPSSGLSPAVSNEYFNIRQGLRSLEDLTQQLTPRADDSHAAPV